LVNTLEPVGKCALPLESTWTDVNDWPYSVYENGMVTVLTQSSHPAAGSTRVVPGTIVAPPICAIVYWFGTHVGDGDGDGVADGDGDAVTVPVGDADGVGHPPPPPASSETLSTLKFATPVVGPLYENRIV
jgi:hypothetical protein